MTTVSDSEHEELIPKEIPVAKKNFMHYLRCDRLLMVSAVSIALGVLIASIVGNVITTASVSNNIERKFGPIVNPIPSDIPEGSKKTLPSAFGIPDIATTPVKNQGNFGTCWAFSTIGALESSYRKHGIEKGFLEEDEYVAFSEQAYALGIVDYCTKYPDAPQCYGTGPAQGNIEDGPTEWLYYFGEEVQKVLPSTACPYQKTEDEITCPDRIEKLKTNPISFKVKGIQSAYSISAIKELLYEKQVGLTWGSVIDTQTYMVPCNLFEPSEPSEECKVCAYPIDPHFDFDVNNPDYSQCYSLYILPSYDDEGQFALHGKPFFAGGHAMVLVGYNDLFRVDTGRFGELEERTLGGFIVKNSWGSGKGHSIKYWTQEISNMEEAQICPDETAATKWLPANVDCMLTAADVAACSDSLYKRVRNQWVTGATVLKCTDITEDLANYYGFGECKKNMNYVLAKAPQIDYLLVKNIANSVWFETPKDGDGFIYVKLLEFDSYNPQLPATLVTTKKTTWIALSKVLTPTDTMIGNDPERCGYYFIPYQYFQEGLVSGPKFGHDSSAVTWFDIEWDDSSYLTNSNKYPQFDYAELIASTGTMKMYDFVGPLDYESIKKV